MTKKKCYLKMLQKYLEEIEIYSDECDGEDSDEENPY